MTTALIIGATGLVGGRLARLLLEDSRFTRVSVFARRSTGLDSPKLDEHIVDFDQLSRWRDRLQGDVLFSALGTTRKQAGSKAAQYEVDYTYQHDVAQAAAQNGVPSLVLVSSIGANSHSRAFYTRIKGELEEAVRAMAFERVAVLRPSMLVGEREHTRMGEGVGGAVMRFAARVLPPARPWRPIPGETVARAMRYLALHAALGFTVHASDGLFALADAS